MARLLFPINIVICGLFFWPLEWTLISGTCELLHTSITSDSGASSQPVAESVGGLFKAQRGLFAGWPGWNCAGLAVASQWRCSQTGSIVAGHCPAAAPRAASADAAPPHQTPENRRTAATVTSLSWGRKRAGQDQGGQTNLSRFVLQ